MSPVSGKVTQKQFNCGKHCLLPLMIAIALHNALCTGQDSPRIDFRMQIEPIFKQHCVNCHGPENHREGLRLDFRGGAQRGGDSQKRILGGPLEENELWKRVSSDDPRYRMPKAANAVSPQQMEVLKRWIEQGSPWPEAAASPSPAESASRWLDLLGCVESFDEWTRRNPHRNTMIALGLTIQILVLLLERRRKRLQADLEMPQGCWARTAAQLRPQHFILLVIGWLGLFAWQLQTAQIRQDALRLKALQQQVRDYSARLGISSTTMIPSIYGDPPVPFRPRHAKALTHVYYRGNCERNPQLFNNGRYRTCTFRVTLCDHLGQELHYGEGIPEAGLFVRFELIRAPYTAPQLFSPEIINSVFLSPVHINKATSWNEAQAVMLQTVEPNEKWQALVPVEPVNQAGKINRLLYVYKGRRDNDTVTGEPHYGLRYDLTITDGKIADESEIWLGCLYQPAVVSLPPDPGKLPFNDWFDEQPIPEITEENTKDPKLLGIPEHVPSATQP